MKIKHKHKDCMGRIIEMGDRVCASYQDRIKMFKLKRSDAKTLTQYVVTGSTPKKIKLGLCVTKEMAESSSNPNLIEGKVLENYTHKYPDNIIIINDLGKRGLCIACEKELLVI